LNQTSETTPLEEENADVTFLKYCLIKFQEIKGEHAEFEALTGVVMKSTVFSRPCLPPDFTLVSWSAHSSTLKMEAVCYLQETAMHTFVTFRFTFS
jgi:hypothetical protein